MTSYHPELSQEHYIKNISNIVAYNKDMKSVFKWKVFKWSPPWLAGHCCVVDLQWKLNCQLKNTASFWLWNFQDLLSREVATDYATLRVLNSSSGNNIQCYSRTHRKKVDSMDVVKFLLLAIAVSGVSSGNTSRSWEFFPWPNTFKACVTPNNENGTCVPLRNCSSLMKMTQVPEVSAETKAFLRKSICQKTNQQIIVCCPLETGTNFVFFWMAL